MSLTKVQPGVIADIDAANQYLLGAFTSGAGTVDGSDTIVEALQKINGNIRALLGGYKTIASVGGSHSNATAKPAGTYMLGYGDLSAVAGTGTVYPVGLIGIYAADYPSVDGMTAKLRIRAQVNCNDTAPTGNYTFGLYPVTRPTVTGATNILNTYTLGTVVAGSDGATVSAPAADSQNSLVSSTFDLPADGQYVIAVVTTANPALNALVHLNAQLQYHYELA